MQMLQVQNPNPAAASTQDASKIQIVLIGITMLLIFGLCLYLLAALWPSKAALTAASSTAPASGPATVPTAPGQNAGEWDTHAVVFAQDISITSDARFIWIVALAAALGSLYSNRNIVQHLSWKSSISRELDLVVHFAHPNRDRASAAFLFCRPGWIFHYRFRNGYQPVRDRGARRPRGHVFKASCR